MRDGSTSANKYMKMEKKSKLITGYCKQHLAQKDYVIHSKYSSSIISLFKILSLLTKLKTVIETKSKFIQPPEIK